MKNISFTFIFIVLSVTSLLAGTQEKRIQNHLIELGYSIGKADGIFGNKSKIALGDLLGVKPKDIPKTFSKEFVDQILRVAGDKGIPWQFYDDFESINWNRYSRTGITRDIAKQGNAEIKTEANGNSYIALASQIGQLSQHNDQIHDIKDRVELGTNKFLARYELEGRTLWYGFNIKSKEPKFSPKAEKITITQMKQILSDKDDKDCAPGVFWRINVHGNITNLPSWAAVTNEFERKVKKIDIDPFITDQWSKVKVGIYFTRSSNGWLVANINGNEIINYSGKTIMDTQRLDCELYFDKTHYLRIGIYRGTNKKFLKGKNLPNNQRDELHFDNFIVTDNEKRVDEVLF